MSSGPGGNGEMGERSHESGFPRHRVVDLDDPQAWSEALCGIPHTFAHTWSGCRILSQASGFRTRLFVRESREGRAVLPFSVRPAGPFADVVTPYGFGGFVGTGAGLGLEAAWRDFARSEGYVAGFIGLNPVIGIPGLERSSDCHVYNEVFVLDLSASEGELFGALSSNRKREVRRLRSGNPRLVRDPEACRRFLVSRADDFLRERGASDASRFDRASLDAILRSPHVFMIGAGSGDLLQAGCAVTHSAIAAEYFLGVSAPGRASHGAALLWEAITELKARNVQWFNLGGGARPGDGIADFKRRFGVPPRPLRCLKHVYRTDVYESLCREAGRDPADRSGYFPPYHRTSGSDWQGRGSDSEAT